jgi:integrase
MSWLPGGSPTGSGREPARFTKRFIDGLEPVAGRRIVIFDAALPGLSVRVSPTGLKVYALKYRNRFGRQRWLTIGHHGILSPDQARHQARKHLRQIAEGLDPAQDKADAARAVTIKQLSERFLSDHVEVHNKHSTQRHVRGDLRNHILPAFGNRAVAELTTDEIAALHLSLRTTPIAANRLIRVLSKMMSQAELWGLRPPHSNPCRGIRMYAQRKRERFLSATEITRLGEVIRCCEGERLIDPLAAKAIRLILLTGCRPSEITNLRWKEVHLDEFFLRLEDSKTGAKVVSLGNPACELLASLPRFDEYVFPSPRKAGSPYRELRRPWNQVRREAGLFDVQLKDLRHTHASVAAQCGLSLPVIGRLLGHNQVSTTQIYAHWADDVLRQAARRVQGRIAAALSGQPGAEVVPIRPGAEPTQA